MPTGYTADVADGKVADFPTFALRCARAFGALIEMRDAPMNAPIPDEFEPSTYYADQIAKLEQELAELCDLTPLQAADRQMAEYQEAIRGWRQRRKDRDERRVRYEKMRADVQAWTPPTPEHEGMKAFMLEQLDESIKWDCSHKYDDRPRKPDPSTSDWLDESVERVRQRLADARESAQREAERIASRNEWVRSLRESLTGFAPTEGAHS